MIVTTASGTVEGVEAAGCLRFAGIPFAQAPVDDLRFRPPRPHPGWSGVRDATRFGPAAPQSPQTLGAPLPEVPRCSEDCLALNVFSPGVEGPLRPVIVWIHGGAFTVGAGDMPWYDGASFARLHDVVVVTINYRLGALGFLALDAVDPAYAGSGNTGILDQIAALRWVRENISAFGGDPECVTVAGGSAGAISISALLAMPAARGLFGRAILQSGAREPGDPAAVAAQVTELFLDAAGVRGVTELARLPVEDILRAQDSVAATMRTQPGIVRAPGGRPVTLPFGPVIDEVHLRQSEIDRARCGDEARIPVLLGTNLDEFRLWSVMAPDVSDAQLDRRMRALHPASERAVAAYRAGMPGASPGEILSRVLTDVTFRLPAIRFAQARAVHSPEVWMYLFTWPSAARDGALGACHLLELPFVFNQLSAAGVAAFAGPHPPQRLALQMHDAWAAFARAGDPSTGELPEWPRYDPARRATMELGERCGVLDDPAGSQRGVWDGIA